jgi:hypothetical protein
MNEPPTNTQAERRENLIDSLLFQIQQDLEDEIPPDFPENSRKVLLEDFLSNSRFVLGNLTIHELESGFALERHIERTVASAKFLIHRVQEQQRSQA